MGIRNLAVIFFIFSVGAPSFAQALDLFEYIDNVLGIKGNSERNLEYSIGERDEDQTGYYLIRPKPQMLPPVVAAPTPTPSPAQPVPNLSTPPILPPVSKPTNPPQPPNRGFTIQPEILEKAPKMESGVVGTPAPLVPEWKNDKKAHWEKEIHQYYGEYLGGEASMARLERETKLYENALFYDPDKARSLDPNKYVLPLNNVNNAKTRVKWRVEPLIYLAFDVEKKITNMLPYDASRHAPGQKIILQPGVRSQYGYEVNQARSFGIGSGPGLQSVIDWANPSWAALKQVSGFVAAAALISEVEGISRHTSSANQDLDMYGTAQPTVENITKHWNVGESYRYGLRGGFLITGGISWMAIAAGPTFIKEGSSEHTVTKIGPDKVMVEVTNLKSFSGQIGLSAVVAGVSVVTKNDIEKMRFTFFYDLSMATGQRAFVQLMNGNYFDTMALIAENQTVAVALMEKDISRVYLDRKSGDYITSWYLGIPFFFWNLSFGKTSDEGALTSYIDSIETRYYHKMYFENFHRRLLFDHKYVTSAFYAGIEQAGKVPLARDPNQDYYGRFIWNFQDESAHRQTLREQLNKLIYFATGLEELDVDAGNVSKDLGYANAEVIVHFDKETTNLLLGTLEGGGSDLITSFHKAVDDYAQRNYPDELDFCQTWDGRPPYYVRHDTDPSKIKSKATLKTECVTLIRKKFEPVIRDMVKELRKMFEALKVNDGDSKKDLATAYRRFGELMMTNRFTFRAVYGFLLDVRAGDILRYIINGENLANMVMYFPSGTFGAPLNTFQK
ncbi:MAG: hypothetical protein A4S09_01180 [Proteobacteria bacterium SG_bin7]|nr:MAG: hypothetical protein A4S09_01180 [Proteobacteria bacterium SG_bin7]